MKAMIFAAGLGTRLYPITQSVPKALVEVNGTPLLGLVIKRLKYFGFDEIMVNVHHFPDLILDYLAENQNFGIHIEISDEREMLLDTGGGLKKASWFFEDGMPFLVHNVDIISTLDLGELYRAHCKDDAVATLAISERKTSRCLLFDKHRTLCGWRNLKTGEEKWARPSLNADVPLLQASFSGIHVIDPKIFGLISQEGKFSIIDTYLEVGKTHRIAGFCHEEKGWIDVGKPDTLEQAHAMLQDVTLAA